MYDSDTTKKIINELKKVKTKSDYDWSPGDVSAPVYGFEIAGTDGFPIYAAWSNNYLITQDGDVYKFNFDFAKLAQKYNWSDEKEMPSLSHFPCAKFLAQDETGWYENFLTPASELIAPKGIQMTLKSWEDDIVTVAFANNSGEDWEFGEGFYLQVSLNGTWYDIPAEVMDYGVIMISNILQNGEEKEKTYRLDIYGLLPVGVYRFVVDGASVEHTIS